jgi:hypothetical protein
MKAYFEQRAGLIVAQFDRRSGRPYGRVDRVQPPGKA